MSPPDPISRGLPPASGGSLAPADVVRLTLSPINRDDAVAFIRVEHRHNKRSLPGWKFGVGLHVGAQLVGVGIAGRCSSRVLDKRGGGHWIEITRVATDGVYNGCSKLYGSLTRAAKALGYCRALHVHARRGGRRQPPCLGLDDRRPPQAPQGLGHTEPSP